MNASVNTKMQEGSQERAVGDSVASLQVPMSSPRSQARRRCCRCVTMARGGLCRGRLTVPAEVAGMSWKRWGDRQV